MYNSEEKDEKISRLFQCLKKRINLTQISFLRLTFYTFSYIIVMSNFMYK